MRDGNQIFVFKKIGKTYILCIYTSESIQGKQFKTNLLLKVLQPLPWCCIDCAIHHERDVREE